jgi:uncharacterized phage infection (PIP) family protein YhgE
MEDMEEVLEDMVVVTEEVTEVATEEVTEEATEEVTEEVTEVAMEEVMGVVSEADMEEDMVVDTVYVLNNLINPRQNSDEILATTFNIIQILYGRSSWRSRTRPWRWRVWARQGIW